MLNIKCIELCSQIGGTIKGDPERNITGINRIETAETGEITFCARQEYEKYLSSTKASCVLLPKDSVHEPGENCTYIYCDNPYFVFVSLIKKIADQQISFTPKIHATAVIGENVNIAEDAYIGPGCVISDGAVIGSKTQLTANVVVYKNVKIGKNSIINAGVTLYHQVEIGNNCIIHAGAVIGADGFGFLEDAETGKYDKIPQIGNVIIGDDVEIGANTTIDRALIGSTIIKNGVKIDNLVQIAHNCFIDENSAFASQVGISGSTHLGKRIKLGGQVGVSGHLEITDDVTIIAQSGVSKSVTKKGIYFGSPIKDRLQAFKIEAVMRRLPEIAADVDKLKKEVLK